MILVEIQRVFVLVHSNVSFALMVKGQILLCVHFFDQLNILQAESNFGHIKGVVQLGVILSLSFYSTLFIIFYLICVVTYY